MLPKRSFSILSSLLLCTALFLVFAAALPVPAQAQGGSACSLATFKGIYSLEVSGQIIDEPGFQFLEGPVSRVGRAVTDGKGNVQFQQKASYNGIPSEEDANATYEVTSDCVITFFINAPPPVAALITFQGAILADGSELWIQQINPGGTTVKVNSRRVQNNCTWEDLKGTYMLDMKGFIPPFTLLQFPPPLPPVIPIGNDAITGDYLEIGVLNFEPPRGRDLVTGKPGNFTAWSNASYGGKMDLNHTWGGTYTIDKACRVNAQLSKTIIATDPITKEVVEVNIPGFAWWGVLADQGRDLRIIQMPLTLGPMDGDAYRSSK